MQKQPSFSGTHVCERERERDCNELRAVVCISKDVHKFTIFYSEMSPHQHKTLNESNGKAHSQKVVTHRAMLRPDLTLS